MQNLINKYNIPGPRYTSYPTVPFWEFDKFTKNDWIQTLKKSFNESNIKEGISIYIHLPYCESLCTFCACHKRITKNHSVEEKYIKYLIKEWDLYLSLFNEKPVIKELHLGGGTPTFFSPNNLKTLLNHIYNSSIIHQNKEFSIEGHPNNTSFDHLRTLFDLGFSRISFGVQDYDPQIQRAINRIQPFENVKKVTELAKSIGYKSISHDLVFGLPFQTLEKTLETIRLTKSLKPDRIAFYSYAHVPWIKGNGQRGFYENDLPSGEDKRILYEKGKEMLINLGYNEIGMDHFALINDDMYKSMISNKLHRNFMGYTSSKTQLMIGLGASSISDSWYSFAQNEKDIEKYFNLLDQNTLPIIKGHLLNKEDLIIRKHILNIMCNLYTKFSRELKELAEFQEIMNRLKEMEKDNLIELSNNYLKITELGRPFLRNISMAFDLRLIRNKPETRLFSMTI